MLALCGCTPEAPEAEDVGLTGAEQPVTASGTYVLLDVDASGLGVIPFYDGAEARFRADSSVTQAPTVTPGATYEMRLELVVKDSAGGTVFSATSSSPWSPSCGVCKWTAQHQWSGIDQRTGSLAAPGNYEAKYRLLLVEITSFAKIIDEETIDAARLSNLHFFADSRHPEEMAHGASVFDLDARLSHAEFGAGTTVELVLELSPLVAETMPFQAQILLPREATLVSSTATRTRAGVQTPVTLDVTANAYTGVDEVILSDALASSGATMYALQLQLAPDANSRAASGVAVSVVPVLSPRHVGWGTMAQQIHLLFDGNDIRVVDSEAARAALAAEAASVVGAQVDTSRDILGMFELTGNSAIANRLSEPLPPGTVFQRRVPQIDLPLTGVFDLEMVLQAAPEVLYTPELVSSQPPNGDPVYSIAY